MKFNQVNWKLAYEWLHEKQALLVEVYKKGDTLKVRHLQISILKDLRLHATLSTQVKTVVLHKLCHSRIHKDLQNSSKM